MAVNEAWIKRLFERFYEIYGDQADFVDKTLSAWTFALDGITAEQIKYALEQCKKDVSILLPTAKLFRELCLQGSMSDSDAKATNKPAMTSSERGYRVPALQWPERKPEASKAVSDDWKQQLLAMDEKSALVNLTSEQRYDRTRLLMEKQGREQVTRLANIAPKEKTISRKDWE